MPQVRPSAWAALTLAIHSHKLEECPCGHKLFAVGRAKRRSTATCACGEQFTALTNNLAIDKLNDHHVEIARRR